MLFSYNILQQNKNNDKEMIIGEGIFFLLIFLWGAMRLKKLFVREQKLQQQQQNFLLAITHELKSPLASVKLYILNQII